MPNKRKKINDKYETFPKGVSRSKVKGVEKIIVRWRGEDGKTDFKYFPDSVEGLAAAVKLNDEKRREKEEQGSRFGILSTDEKQAVEIWRAYRDECRREGCGYAPMVEVVREAIELFRQKSIAPFFGEVAREYVKAEESKGVTEEHLRVIESRVKRMNERLGGERICHITPAKIEDFLNELRGKDRQKSCAPTTRRGYMVLIGAIFNHAIRRGYVKDDPVQALQKPTIKQEDPDVLNVEECRKIFQWASKNALHYLPGLAINMFCGVRPTELTKLRYADIFPGGREEIFIPRKIAKGGIERFAKLRNAAAWLEYAKAKAQGASMNPGDYVLPGEKQSNRKDNYAKLISKRIKKGCGLQYEKDALRHTAVSMLCALIGRAGAAMEHGHDGKTQVKHYRVAITDDEAKAFFEITPASLGL